MPLNQNEIRGKIFEVINDEKYEDSFGIHMLFDETPMNQIEDCWEVCDTLNELEEDHFGLTNVFDEMPEGEIKRYDTVHNISQLFDEIPQREIRKYEEFYIVYHLLDEIIVTEMDSDNSWSNLVDGDLEKKSNRKDEGKVFAYKHLFDPGGCVVKDHCSFFVDIAYLKYVNICKLLCFTRVEKVNVVDSLDIYRLFDKFCESGALDATSEIQEENVHETCEVHEEKLQISAECHFVKQRESSLEHATIGRLITKHDRTDKWGALQHIVDLDEVQKRVTLILMTAIIQQLVQHYEFNTYAFVSGTTENSESGSTQIGIAVLSYILPKQFSSCCEKLANGQFNILMVGEVVAKLNNVNYFSIETYGCLNFIYINRGANFHCHLTGARVMIMLTLLESIFRNFEDVNEGGDSFWRHKGLIACDAQMRALKCSKEVGYVVSIETIAAPGLEINSYNYSDFWNFPSYSTYWFHEKEKWEYIFSFGELEFRNKASCQCQIVRVAICSNITPLLEADHYFPSGLLDKLHLLVTRGRVQFNLDDFLRVLRTRLLKGWSNLTTTTSLTVGIAARELFNVTTYAQNMCRFVNQEVVALHDGGLALSLVGIGEPDVVAAKHQKNGFDDGKVWVLSLLEVVALCGCANVQLNALESLSYGTNHAVQGVCKESGVLKFWNAPIVLYQTIFKNLRRCCFTSITCNTLKIILKLGAIIVTYSLLREKSRPQTMQITSENKRHHTKEMDAKSIRSVVTATEHLSKLEIKGILFGQSLSWMKQMICRGPMEF